MTNKRAIEIISQAAVTYQRNFSEKNLIIVYGNAIKPEFIETKSLSRNFLHLTGVILNENVKDNSAERFLEKVLTHNLNENDFILKDSTTEQKLKVLYQTLNIQSNAKMIGDFSGNRVNLKTDKVAGGVKSFLGFVKVGEQYVPNTVIEGDIKKDTHFTSRVLAILSKDIKEPAYNEIKYVAKKIDINLLLQKIKKDISIDPDLLLPSHQNISTPPIVNLFSANTTPSGGAAVLAPPRPIFGQAVSSFMGKIKQFFEDKSTENQRLIKDLKKALSKRDTQLAERNDEIADLKRECAELSNQLEKQKQLVTTAAKPTKTFAQGLDEMLRKQYTNKSAASNQQTKKPTKPKL